MSGSASIGTHGVEQSRPTSPLSAAPIPLRATQSFLSTLSRCWRMPSLLGLELLWRWSVGIPAAALLTWLAFRILSSVSLAHTGIGHFSLIDSASAALTISQIADILLPRILPVALWVIPLLAIAWSVASGFGRSAVLRRYDGRLLRRPWMLAGMQLLRIVVLGCGLALWFCGLHGIAELTLSGAEPDLVAYFVLAILLSFAAFACWSLVGWVFTIAPLLGLFEGGGWTSVLRASLRTRGGSLAGLRPKLIEINLVLGIVKAALVVLAMVFCATPVPFKEEMAGSVLYGWWAAVTVAYAIASDFFQIARLAGYIDLWRARNLEQQRAS